MSQQETNVKAFVTSAVNPDATQRAGEPITVSVDGREVTFNAPDSNQVVLLAAAIEGTAKDTALAATLINAFFAMIATNRDVAYFKGRLFDSDDSFALNNVSDILSYLLEEWSARPTESSPASSGLPSNGGKTSKGKRHGHKSGSGKGH